MYSCVHTGPIGKEVEKYYYDNILQIGTEVSVSQRV